MKRTISSGHLATMIAAASSTTFFHSVCQLVSTMASPKQPQSLMGLASASHSVSGVIISRMTTIILEVSLRLMAKSMKMPRQNSRAARATESISDTMSGIHSPRCKACR